ncbi:unnamed protein product [Diplocarpon coronariae]
MLRWYKNFIIIIKFQEYTHRVSNYSRYPIFAPSPTLPPPQPQLQLNLSPTNSKSRYNSRVLQFREPIAQG